MHWSNTVEDYYPVFPQPRGGFGKPFHPHVWAALEDARDTFNEIINDLDRYANALFTVPHDPAPDSTAPYWNNSWFSCLDAALLMTLLLSRQPGNYIEIGSGHSTMFARHAINLASSLGGRRTTVISIDPLPRAEIDALCDRVVRVRLEECDLDIFDALGPGDILFFDGSHRIFANSDTTTFLLDILPRLPPGVLVHLHDIFLPADYPPAWNARLYSEQYVLASMLMCGSPPFRVIMPAYFACEDKRMGARIQEIFRRRPEQPVPFLYNNDANIPGVSFWLETTGNGRVPGKAITAIA